MRCAQGDDKCKLMTKICYGWSNQVSSVHEVPKCPHWLIVQLLSHHKRVMCPHSTIFTFETINLISSWFFLSLRILKSSSESFGPCETHVRVIWASCLSLPGLVEPMPRDSPNGGPSNHKPISSQTFLF